MKSLYLLAFILALLWIAAQFVRRPREGVLYGLFTTTICPEALPVNVIDGIGLASQLGFFLLTLFYLLLRRGGMRMKYVGNTYNVCLVAFALLMTVYILPSTAPGYGWSKVFFFSLKSILPVFLLSALAPFSRREIRRAGFALVGASLLAALGVLTSGTFGTERATLGDISTISVSRAVGLGCVLLIGFVVTGEKKGKVLRLGALALASLCLIVMVASGSRGPITALVGAILALVLAAPMSLRERLATFSKFLLFVGTVVVGTIYYGVGTLLRQLGGLQRIVVTFAQLGEGSSDRGRLHRLSVAVDEFIDSNGLGIGTGEYLDVYPYTKGEGREYPHNLFFEAAAEQGIIGLLLVTTIVLIPVLKFYKLFNKYRDNVYAKLAFSLFVYSFLNSMVSGDVPMNSLLWISGGVLWLVAASESERSARQSLSSSA
jgi:O-antigen ligase